METQEIAVNLGNNRTATVTRQGDTYLVDDGSMTRRFSFGTILILARYGETPEWCGQIPGLSERIELVFETERAQGRDPFTLVASERGRLTVTDLRSKTSWGAPIADLKRQLAQTGRLPRAFDSPAARKLIDLAA